MESPGTLVTSISTGNAALRKIVVEVVEGADAGTTFVLGPVTAIIGTHSDADLVLKDPKISRRHCEVQLLADGIRVRDLGSKNGVVIADSKVSEAVMGIGGAFRLGDTLVRLTARDEEVAIKNSWSFGDLKTESPKMAQIYGLLARACKSDATIMIEGETGVGKDVLARAVHDESNRSKGPMVVFDCSSVPATLIAGELFGHKKGAFTGAVADRAGVFEDAKGGTVFLDEIGELPLDLQPMLLRLLENREVRRVGESKTRPLDVRVVVATNRELKKESDEGRFRQDLFYRLAVVRIHVPPLRDRLVDVPILARRLLTRLKVPTDAISSGDLQMLMSYSWPGNVRELKNVLEQSAALSPPDRFCLMPPRPDTTAATEVPAAADDDDDNADSTASGIMMVDDQPYKEARGEMLRQFEAHYIETLLNRHEGNLAAAAREAGIDRNYVYRLMKRYGLDRTGQKQ